MNTISEDVIAAQQGNLVAFERLVNATRNTVTSVALGVVKDVDVSEDIAQQAFINCWKNLKTLKSAHSFLPWLRQSTRYLAINYLRDNKVKSKVSGEEAELLFAQFGSETDYPEDSLNDIQKKRIIGQLLETLPDESREVVVLYYREEQSTAMVSELLGISEAGIRKRLSRARAQLKEHAMERFGNALLITAPTISFTSIVIASLTVSPSVTASTGAVSQAGWLSKAIGALSGALVGLVAAVLAVIWSHNKAENSLHDEKLKKQLLVVRNVTLTWLVVFSAVFVVAFHYTKGVWAPVSAYTLFAIGLYALVRRSQLIVRLDMKTNPNIDVDSKAAKPQSLWGAVGLYGGIIIGFVSLVLGLVGAGRL